MTEKVQYYGTGRRKTAVARVWLRSGNGKVLVNGRGMEDFFPSAILRQTLQQPLMDTNTNKFFDVIAKVSGGGYLGQADAVKLGIARALLKSNPALKKPLRDGGFLTRDPRDKERKKYGQKGARRRFQFSKR